VTVPFRRLRTGDRNLDAVQDNVDEALRPLIENPLMRGSSVAFSLSSGSATKVPHRLGTVPVGFFLVSPTAAGHVWQADSPTRLFLTLRSDANITGSLYVF
jgi:hypothetical protein